MNVQRLSPQHAPAYRALMLEAYAAHPDAFTSTVGERAALPIAWWEARLADGRRPGKSCSARSKVRRCRVWPVLSFESREKARHKATLFGMYVPAVLRGRGTGTRIS